jgi:Group II intron, maturase-specific domain
VSKALLQGGEQTNGPQQSVNAIASSNFQPKGDWESRAAHVTAKAKDNILERNGWWISPGSQAVARWDRTARNRGDPTWRPRRASPSIDVKQLIAELTPVLRGWGNYFRTGNADREFNGMDSYVVTKLRRWQRRRGGQRPTKRPPFTGPQLYGMGLHRLMGTVCYPTQATPRRSSVSRVPENGMHGLKGGHMVQGRL